MNEIDAKQMNLLELDMKKELVNELCAVYSYWFDEIDNIELKRYKKKGTEHTEEFVLLTWSNGGISTANNNINSLSATARNVARMIDGGVYENLDSYKKIMESDEWEEIRGTYEE